MSIESSRPVQSLAPLQNIDGNTVQAQKNKTAASARNQENQENQENQSTVSLSDTLDQLQKQDSQDIDVAKVERIKDAIRDGSLTMDSGKIADALISQAQSMLDD
ncbi:Negative regulator of flagellin synthesis [Sodalis glossinidius str. 'morsitans']|uniref:Negative regulator of flagellin synthesis n=1 Tax=Sodalis glossinidius (strain morsitans) TaxID=343509 RepID=Q2NR89_SODGM|nr:flagellar biosynthesis anti-sigma factor FlgM [Sodalis glossinidius]BAE75336.1 negative regulator of flagellin synthesis FlgM [Sodalis glossinidius str. 'morsitans']CRL46354.1 Negative regulator of flagellin synthesis [Sodalis glossinidius str. 'morsitans']